MSAIKSHLARSHLDAAAGDLLSIEWTIGHKKMEPPMTYFSAQIFKQVRYELDIFDPHDDQLRRILKRSRIGHKCN